jgi:hypothetical protein
MFPNFRLMIATVFGCVVALICGFSIFATLHVRHEPLVRRPRAIPPLQLLADNAEALPVGATKPFGRPFQSGEREDGRGVAAMPYSAVPPTVVMNAALPAADDHELHAVERAPLTLPADPGDAAAPATPATIAETTPDIKPDETAQATKPGEAAPETKPDAAAAETSAQAASPVPAVASSEPASAEPPPEEAAPTEQTTITDTAAASFQTEPAPAPPENATKIVDKKTKHTRVAAKAHVTRKVRIGAIARLQRNKQTVTSSEANFLTAPQSWSQPAQKQAARTARSRAAATTAVSTAGTGGPFVSAPAR